MAGSAAKINSAEIQNMILNCLRNLNEESDEEDRFEIREDMKLIGSDSDVDSMALVTLIMDIETAVLDEHGEDISMVTEEAMSRSRSPFRSVTTLTEYVGDLLAASDD